MKIAVISDIHGFSIALERVLASIDSERGMDRIIAAGDFCEGGPDPAGALSMLQERQIELVQGNTDRDLAQESRGSAAARWVSEQIGEEGLTLLAGLPFDIRVTPPAAAAPGDDLLVVHANPHDQDQHLHPDLSDRELRDIIGRSQASVIAFGHIHIAYIREIDGITLIDVSAVGNPKDEDLRSKWGLITWNEDARDWTAELRYVEYPVEETLRQIETSGMPNPRKVIRKLLNASYRE